MNRNFLFIIAMLLLVYSPAYSQCFLSIKYSPQVDQHKKLKKAISKIDQVAYRDSNECVIKARYLLATMLDYGFLGASIDSIYGNSDTMNFELYSGTLYRWAKLNPGDTDEGLISSAGFRDKFYDNRAFSLKGTLNLNRKLLKYCENNGYPFAAVSYKDVSIKDDEILATLDLNPGVLYTYDTISVLGTARLSKKYLNSYLSVKPGDAYDESQIKKIPNRLKELPMVNETRPFVIAFTEDKARAILYLEDKKASQIDGVIGILPDNNNAGKVLVTGELRLRLLSSLGRGELIDFNWKQPQKQTQDLKVHLNYPFMFSTPLGVDFNLGIYRRDTTFSEVLLGAGLQLLMKRGNYLQAFVEKKSSGLLSTNQYKNATTLPEFADVSLTSYGLALKSTKLDYRLNPRRGYSTLLSFKAGNKKIEKNSKINPELYDGLELNTVQYNGSADFSYFIPLPGKFVIMTGILSAALVNENLFTNELYRIGGLKTLRGFDEESILASSYIIGIIESRFQLEQNSFLFLFFNTAWYERNYRGTYINDTPLGFGAGITFETKLGIFSLNYALGKEFDNQVQFRAAKVHFGLVNYF